MNNRQVRKQFEKFMRERANAKEQGTRGEKTPLVSRFQDEGLDLWIY